MENLPKDKKIILFDGVCNLCNSAVLFIIKQDSKDLFRFVALQSELEKNHQPYWDRLPKDGQYYSI
jgi:predicted DCC family thiol-disulfide oxidoreductase YuxK